MVRTDEDHLLRRCHPKEGAAGLKKKSKMLVRIFKNNNNKKFLMMSVNVTVYIEGGGDFFQIENVIYYSINQMLTKFFSSDQRRRPQSMGRLCSVMLTADWCRRENVLYYMK